MASIERWVLVDRDNNEDDYEYESYPEAEEAASQQDKAVIERVYQYDDSELVWTPKGDDTWPPTDDDDEEDEDEDEEMSGHCATCGGPLTRRDVERYGKYCQSCENETDEDAS